MSWLGYVCACAAPATSPATSDTAAMRAKDFTPNCIGLLPLFGFLAERGFPRPLELWKDDQGDHAEGQDQQRQRNRAFKEDHRIAARDHQRPAQVLLHQRSQNK